MDFDETNVNSDTINICHCIKNVILYVLKPKRAIDYLVHWISNEQQDLFSCSIFANGVVLRLS